ncbi:hypothetical protein BDA96_04G082200 [Sorghum bicolor]|uniref:Knottins-like domain-containing protein n=2 Tax=Sorghum bicolor TaxID=4558 RepID=A0A1Z5RLB6_SORBI|nr:hypothetical protein BDA96_04G082200 [Sorghum bicolor]OQU84550.1 hypothetical protein SORBI_3004G075351 [Sorghum bicolor]
MAPSRKNLSAAVLLIIVIMAAVCSMPACGQCRHLSGRYHGLCFRNYACNNACSFEEPEIIYGACDHFKCYCYTC